jgi:transcriptional regulator with XRE-family HTH domain
MLFALVHSHKLKHGIQSDLNRIVGENVKRLRKQLYLSQDDFADRAGIHRTYVGGVERGERNISLNTLAQFASALETTPQALLSALLGASGAAKGDSDPGIDFELTGKAKVFGQIKAFERLTPREQTNVLRFVAKTHHEIEKLAPLAAWIKSLRVKIPEPRKTSRSKAKRSDS